MSLGILVNIGSGTDLSPIRHRAITWTIADSLSIGTLTPKHRETRGCVVSTVATDALVLKHQAISIHNAD